MHERYNLLLQTVFLLLNKLATQPDLQTRGVSCAAAPLQTQYGTSWFCLEVLVTCGHTRSQPLSPLPFVGPGPSNFFRIPVKPAAQWETLSSAGLSTSSHPAIKTKINITAQGNESSPPFSSLLFTGPAPWLTTIVLQFTHACMALPAALHLASRCSHLITTTVPPSLTHTHI